MFKPLITSKKELNVASQDEKMLHLALSIALGKVVNLVAF
jgi:hypothetical protein